LQPQANMNIRLGSPAFASRDLGIECECQFVYLILTTVQQPTPVHSFTGGPAPSPTLLRDPRPHTCYEDMSSGQRPERVVHQDYIARIRYTNTLPPPPNPPKLLDIPGTGLAGGQYTSAGYASRLAREQPLNIEADAELGMPIDLIGIPGIFDGDERGM